MAKDTIKLILNNRKASHDYELGDKFEAGIALVGSEVKSLRDERVTSLSDAYVVLKNGEAWLQGLYIPPYPWANRNNHEPTRSRKLLLHRHELKKLRKLTREAGMTLVPLRLYWKGNKVKLAFAAGKGKKHYDKRQDLRAKDAKREMDRRRR